MNESGGSTLYLYPNELKSSSSAIEKDELEEQLMIAETRCADLKGQLDHMKMIYEGIEPASPKLSYEDDPQPNQSSLFTVGKKLSSTSCADLAVEKSSSVQQNSAVGTSATTKPSEQKRPRATSPYTHLHYSVDKKDLPTQSSKIIAKPSASRQHSRRKPVVDLDALSSSDSSLLSEGLEKQLIERETEDHGDTKRTTQAVVQDILSGMEVNMNRLSKRHVNKCQGDEQDPTEKERKGDKLHLYDDSGEPYYEEYQQIETTGKPKKKTAKDKHSVAESEGYKPGKQIKPKSKLTNSNMATLGSSESLQGKPASRQIRTPFSRNPKLKNRRRGNEEIPPGIKSKKRGRTKGAGFRKLSAHQIRNQDKPKKSETKIPPQNSSEPGGQPSESDLTWQRNPLAEYYSRGQQTESFVKESLHSAPAPRQKDQNYNQYAQPRLSQSVANTARQDRYLLSETSCEGDLISPNYAEPEIPDFNYRNFTRPTVASQMKQIDKDAWQKKFLMNLQNLPFVVGTSTAPSHNLKMNIQQVLSLLKTNARATCDVPSAVHAEYRYRPPVQMPKARYPTTASATAAAFAAAAVGRSNPLKSGLQQQQHPQRAICPALIRLASQLVTGVANEEVEGKQQSEPTARQWSIEKDENEYSGRCVCLPRHCTNYQKVLDQYVLPRTSSIHQAYGNSNFPPKHIQSQVPRQPDQNISFRDLREQKRQLKHVLRSLHDDFCALSRKYSEVKHGVDRGMVNSHQAKQALEELEQDLHTKETKISTAMAAYKEVKAVMEEVKTSQRRDRTYSMEDQHLSACPNLRQVEETTSVNHMQDAIRRPNRAVAVEDSTASLRYLKLLRQVQQFQAKLRREEVIV